ncbi:GNAT family N-acetyltransferase [Corallococcus exiguus]|uniref:GNAT family N-acetyltransferase n=1 Tax=Corallococcus exiguus TaxID=83462 RepID=UPI001560CDEA|nr:GNAT family N-acetyltransferase [Corallococcus exiguus]
MTALAATPPAEARAAPGRLEVRLAHDATEIDAAQALRFQVFGEELGAWPLDGGGGRRRDVDRYDAVADHLVVLDHAVPDAPAVVGTFRLLGREQAACAGGFYSAGEFHLEPLLQEPGEVLELGRACVAPAARGLPVMHLLWRGIAEQVFLRGVTLLFGCASFPGADPRRCASALAWLRRHHLAPRALRPHALPHLRVPPEFEVGLACSSRPPHLPPLIEGGLRLGGFIGDGAAIDREFNTVDVLMMVRLHEVTGRYARHYARAFREQARSSGPFAGAVRG